MDKGIEKSIEKKNTEIAIKMLQQKAELKLISQVTGLSSEQITRIKNTI